MFFYNNIDYLESGPTIYSRLTIDKVCFFDHAATEHDMLGAERQHSLLLAQHVELAVEAVQVCDWLLAHHLTTEWQERLIILQVLRGLCTEERLSRNRSDMSWSTSKCWTSRLRKYLKWSNGKKILKSHLWPLLHFCSYCGVWILYKFKDYRRLQLKVSKSNPFVGL